MNNNTLKQRLKRLDMTQKDLADALGINPVSVSRWETTPTYADAFLKGVERYYNLKEQIRKLGEQDGNKR